MELKQFQFECVAIGKEAGRFTFEPVQNFYADVAVGSVAEEHIFGDYRTSNRQGSAPFASPSRRALTPADLI